jgi:hypothetical protein
LDVDRRRRTGSLPPNGVAAVSDAMPIDTRGGVTVRLENGSAGCETDDYVCASLVSCP